MIRRPFAIAAAGACLALAPAAARAKPHAPPPVPVLQAGERLDGHGTVAYALAHAPSLLAQRATIASLVSNYTKLRAGEFPSATGELQNQLAKSANESGQFAQFGIAPSTNFSQNTAQLSSTYNLYNGTQQIAAEQARKQLASAKFELARQEEQTTVAVSNAFYALAAQSSVVTLDEADVAYQQQLLDIAKAEERVGRVAGVDVLRAQVAVARSTSTLVQARADVENAREALAVQIGAPTDTQFDVPETLPEPAAPKTSAADLRALAERNRPEIASALATLDASKLGDAAVDSDLRPIVQANASFGSQLSPTSLVQQQQAIDAANAQTVAQNNLIKNLFPFLNIPGAALLPPVDRRRPGFWQFNVTSTFQIPLFDYGQRAAAHHAARAQIDASTAALENAYDSVRSDVDAARRNLDAAEQKLKLAKLSAQLARESARIAQLQYKAGLISFTDTSQTEQTALAAENDLVAARVSYVTALIKLRASLAPPDAAAAADLRGL
jgi:outer membrane protein TolC